MVTTVPPLSYELRLGVTGHRSLADEAGVARALDALLERIDRALNHQDVAPLAWTVVSPLARGADRLLAQAVLNRGGRLEVVTPLPLADYRRDFAPGADLEQFEQLFARAASIAELPGVVAPGFGEDRQNTEIDRNASYLQVGEWVIGACELLVAVWNGRRAKGVGGSASVVEEALKEGRMVVWIHSDRPRDPPRVVRSLRFDDHGELAADAVADFPSTQPALSYGYHQHASYCRDTSISPRAYAPAIAATTNRLLDAADHAGLPREYVEPGLSVILPHLVRADALARFYQRRHTWIANGVLYLAAAGVTVAVLQVLFFPLESWIVAFEVLAMAGVFALWRYGRHEASHEKWLSDRYLTERLRVALFTTLTGIVPSPPSPDERLPFYPGPQHWLPLAVSTVSRSASQPVGTVPFEPLKRFVVDAWIDDQRQFHAATAATKLGHQRRRHIVGFGLFGLTLLMALLHLSGKHPGDSHGSTIVRGDLWVIFFALVLPVWAGVVHSITSQMELERIAERSRRMAKVLERFADRALGARTPEELQKVCMEAAEVMTVETHEWRALLSFQGVRLHV